MNPAVKLAPARILAVVAGGADHEDACVVRATHRKTERIIVITVHDQRAEAEIDDANVVCIFIGEAPVERRDDRAFAANAVVIQHAQADQIRARRNAAISFAATGEQRGDLSPVTIDIIGAPLPRKILAIDHSRMTCRRSEQAVFFINSAVENHNADACPVQPEILIQ